ncbi:MAG: NfeD family protein [Candidatus Cohnella colombiensis]|uniref:NfeD family protein n=1 Tax=Candidatus Cohnella colombiensis TaxID=3121368 RepID=A0AA95F1N3_9BACL|nr:MAG: NfeD family protein [Cohnella sp.]
MFPKETSRNRFRDRWLQNGRIMLLCVLLGLPLLAIVASNVSAKETQTAGSVYVIPVHQTVESGLESFLERALTEAEEAKASLVILDINTPGGRLGTAEDIGQRIRETTVPTVAFVTGKAASAGAYLALNAGDIVMAPATTIGAAMIVDQSGNAVENPKYVSFWSEEMASAAELNGRNRDIAVKMVDPDRVLELKDLGLSYTKGTILSLSADQALKVGYSELSAKSVDEILAWKGLSDRTIVELEPSLAERISEFITSSTMSTVLLILGIAGVAIELLVPGFGVPGIVGLLAFGLYFFGQSIAGFAGMESIVIFIIGIILLIIEMFAPSFGVLGVVGTVAIIFGITMGAYDTGNALQSLGIAFVVAIVVVAIFVYIFRKRGVWNRFILDDELTSEQGYVPNEDRDQWLGQEGIVLSALRPAGVVEIDGQRLDVVSSGEFIEKGTAVVVQLVDGTRIVVKEKVNRV